MVMGRMVVLVTLAAAAAVSPAFGETAFMRPGQPEVLRPSRGAAEATDQVLARFRRRYVQNGSPRMAILWNQTLPTRADERLRGVVSGGGTHHRIDPTRRGGVEIDQRWASGTFEVDRFVREPGRAGPGEVETWELRTAFVSTLREAGARLVDPQGAQLALQASGAGPEGPRKRSARALVQRADLTVEVLLTPDATAEHGWLFRVAVKSVRTGALLADISSRASVPAGERGFVATSRGFERPATTLRDVGRELALQTMQNLARNL